jgi:hypothetical protein
MLLPSGHNAIIDDRKLREYCLSPEHEEGKHKAILFHRLLGLTANDAPRLVAALRKAAEYGEASEGLSDRYGQRYVIDFDMPGAAGSIAVRSAWIVRAGEDMPRLITCYII